MWVTLFSVPPGGALWLGGTGHFFVHIGWAFFVPADEVLFCSCEGVDACFLVVLDGGGVA